MLKKYVIPTALVTAFAFTPVLAEQSGYGSNSKAEGQDQQMGMEQGQNDADALVIIFEDLDQNQDGVLDEDELNTWGATAAGSGENKDDNMTHGERMRERYDRDGDGTISLDEMGHGSMSGPGSQQ